MKDLTSSVFTFEDFIQGNFLYVDKTEYIWNLIRPKKAGYFLSRPHHFGKSLLISTLKAIFDILKCLKGFYGVLKDRNDKERLLFLTDVSKYCHVSLFSELNDLTDITMNQKYAGMLGFTTDEIRRSFADCLPEAAMANGLDVKVFMARLLQWYDGYRFSDADIHVCNPVSIMNFFQDSSTFYNVSHKKRHIKLPH